MNKKFSMVRWLASVVALITISIFSGLTLQAQQVLRNPVVTTAVKFDISPPLSEIEPITSLIPKKAEDDDTPGPVNDFRHDPDGALQSSIFIGERPEVMPAPEANFNGMTGNGPIPPDTVGDIGPNHYVQMVNSRFQIFNRDGTVALTARNINTLFTGFGGPCQTENAGDPIVLYDQLADRWLLSQFSDASAPFFNCVAVSTTGNPLGSYYRYAFEAPFFPDYPKYGVWPDGYYLNTRESAGGILGNFALERLEMIAGNPAARSIRFTTTEIGGGVGPNGLLPADLDGTRLPPAGAPNYFVGSRDNGAGAPSDALILYKFDVDWVNTANSTFTGPTVMTTSAFDSVFPCTPTSRDCIPQPGTAAKIDILSYRQRPTWRLAYRNFGTHEALVTTQSVESSVGIAGMRWWEIRNPAGTPAIFQEGTYGPGATDSIHRWMGSIAQDRLGNMALGYSVSAAATVFPGIRYTGRLVSDAAGTLPQGEGIAVDGAGSQTSGQRWGDYTSMNIDPLNDCTFWYTNQYYVTNSSFAWRTRVTSFTYPSCRASIPRSRADFDGDGRTDLSVFRSTEGNWYINRSSGSFTVQKWGLDGDIPIPGDYDGDQRADIAVYRGNPDDTQPDFFIFRSQTNTFAGFSWGLPGDRPMTGDFDGDQKADLTVFRPSENNWYILGSTGTVRIDNFGSAGDVPMAMDYEGDGLSNIAVFRPSNRIWYIAKPTGVPAQNFYAVEFGLATDMPVPADYNGDQSDDIAMYRAGVWYVLNSGGTVTVTNFGLGSDIPVPGDYDGDGSDDIAVYRDGTWYLNRSTSGIAQFNFGIGSDRPIPKSYIP